MQVPPDFFEGRRPHARGADEHVFPRADTVNPDLSPSAIVRVCPCSSVLLRGYSAAFAALAPWPRTSAS